MTTINRQLTLRSDSLDVQQRQVNAVVATENPTDVYDSRSGSIISEILLMDGVEVGTSVPLLRDHDRSVPSTIGHVEGFRQEGAELKAVLSFAAGTTAADEAWTLVSGRHISGISVGYRVMKYIDLRPGETATVGGRSFTAPSNRTLRITEKWAIKEISLVPIPADESSGIRADSSHNYQRKNRMSIVSTLGNHTGTMRFRDIAAISLRSRGQQVEQNDVDTVRAWAQSVDGANELMGIVNAAILDGYRSAPDSTSGWVQTIDAPDYLAGEIAALTAAPALGAVAAGGTAPEVSFGVSASGFRVAKFAASFMLDEVDLVDGKNLSVYQAALRQIGAAARNVIPDLVWSLVLGNPNLGDGDALFAAGRGNLGTAALAAPAVDAAVGVVAGQTLDDGADGNVHVNLAARFLIVPPTLINAARRIARDVSLGDGQDLAIRGESRLSTTGTTSPLTGAELAGNGTNWLLAAPAAQAPSIVVALLNGKSEPTVRQFALKGGEGWGFGFDVAFNCGVSAVDGKPLYFSAGTG